MSSIRTIVCFLFAYSFSFGQGNSFTIKGSLLGADGKPISVANIHLLSNAPRTPRFLLQSNTVSRDGKFQLSFAAPGLYRLQFTGIDHYPLDLPVYVQNTEPVVVFVQLKSYESADSLSNVRIIGEFNRFSFFKGAQPMVKQPDGTYSATVEAKAETLAYQIMGIERTGRSTNGTQSDYYIYDGGGDYRSVLRTKIGPRTVIFDPRNLKHSTPEANVKFENANSFAARFYRLHLDLERRQLKVTQFYEGLIAAGKRTTDFQYDRSSDLADAMKLRMEEVDPTMKNAWLLAAIQYGALKMDSTLSDLALNSIAPISPLWSYFAFALPVTISKSSQKSKRVPYLQEVADYQTDREYKPLLISYVMDFATASGDSALVSRYYQTLATEFYNSEYFESAKTRHDPSRAIKVGKPIPNFSVTSLEDANVVFSNKSLLGHVYLIDFWAVWCAPCVAEMKTLHTAYERFKSKGLMILSLSFDGKPETIAKFRTEKWPMPWMHTLVKGGFINELSKTFEVYGIPKPILVGPDGKIIATEANLHGEKLLSTLSKVFSQ